MVRARAPARFHKVVDRIAMVISSVVRQAVSGPATPRARV
jgi:hypothetical protein